MGGLPRWRRRAHSGAAVFGFHNVVADAQTAESGDRSLHIAVADFRRYLDWIESAYQVVPLTELIARLGRSRPVGGLAVLSFDDAYAGFIRHGVPSLRERALPFVVFPVTDAATQPRPFWWDAAGPVSPAQRDEWLRASRRRRSRAGRRDGVGSHSRRSAGRPHAGRLGSAPCNTG